MLLPIIDSFIREVNNLAGDPNSPSFDEELTSCLIVMTNETNPVNLGCKFFMLNISLSVLRKILTYLTILKLRSDSLRSNGETIDQAVLTLALKGIVYAIGREEEPIDGWKTVNRETLNQSTAAMEISSDDNSKERTLNQHPVVPMGNTATSSSTVPIPGRSVRQTNTNRSSRNSTDSPRAMTGPRPGTSKQSTTTYRQSPNRPESAASDEPTPGKQLAKGLFMPARGATYSGRRGRTSSISSTSSISPLSLLSPSPSAESRPESRPESSRSSPSSTITAPIRLPVIQSIESMTVKPEPSTSNSTTLSSLSSASVSSTASSASTLSSDEPAFGLKVTFASTVSIPIHEGLVQVLDPYRDRIETSPICANHIFIKLKCKKDIYFLKRQIEILTRLMPRIVVTKFSRFSLDVPKQLVPTIKEFVNLNVDILKGEYYVYSRISTSDENITTIEILANTECQQSIESSYCLLKIGHQTLQAVPIGCYQECPLCFFCYDDAHPECSRMTFLAPEGFV